MKHFMSFFLQVRPPIHCRWECYYRNQTTTLLLVRKHGSHNVIETSGVINDVTTEPGIILGTGGGPSNLFLGGLLLIEIGLPVNSASP